MSNVAKGPAGTVQVSDGSGLLVAATNVAISNTGFITATAFQGDGSLIYNIAKGPAGTVQVSDGSGLLVAASGTTVVDGVLTSSFIHADAGLLSNVAKGPAGTVQVSDGSGLLVAATNVAISNTGFITATAFQGDGGLLSNIQGGGGGCGGGCEGIMPVNAGFDITANNIVATDSLRVCGNLYLGNVNITHLTTSKGPLGAIQISDGNGGFLQAEGLFANLPGLISASFFQGDGGLLSNIQGGSIGGGNIGEAPLPFGCGFDIMANNITATDNLISYGNVYFANVNIGTGHLSNIEVVAVTFRA